MSRSLSVELRSQVRERARARCEYCLVPDFPSFFAHETDHIIAEQHGGEAIPENPAFSCMQCNRAKGTNIASVDPATRQPVFLFNPRRDAWAEHFELEGASIVGFERNGRATASLLKFNERERLGFRALLLRQDAIRSRLCNARWEFGYLFLHFLI